MLVDLGRNDVGRVSEVGTVRVTALKTVERYSHVMHLVSEVRGQLAPGLSAVDVLRATFPAGTVSGSPKVRAMEIIDELEPARRGPYAGAVGYFDRARRHGDVHRHPHPAASAGAASRCRRAAAWSTTRSRRRSTRRR